MTVDVDTVLGLVDVGQPLPTEHDIGSVVVGGEPLRIPARIYCPEPEPPAVAALTGSARTVLHCLFTRHHDGHVREAHLREVISSPLGWVPPYVVQLLGEYVIEIHRVIQENVRYLRQETYSRFVAENPAFIGLTRQRAISYWNCYFRSQHRALSNYVAHQVLEVLDPCTA